MKVLIIEDEEHNANRLQKIIKGIRKEVDIIGVLPTITESIAFLKTNRTIDLILMDIRLSDGLSFEIFSEVEIKTPIIFTTAYDEYMLDAFKVNSLDYLLKPIEPTELSDALDKLDRVKTYYKSEEAILNMLDFFKGQNKQYRSRFLIPFRDGYKTVQVTDVDFIYSEFKITHVVIANGATDVISQTLEELEDQLDPAIFFRANRQYIVSLGSIHSITNAINGKLKIILKKRPKDYILISKVKASFFKKWLDQ
ncbi:LytR/AlgR family response regulator transcription factor [Flavobacterium sp. '19STA2R22 D10 B1']|uniref:LytR/AlgR family response regulator transcription factor n=1 Tax=Flavobacterium aerium TaxID=3037261 RepID=UPI00278BD496|nr:LytTR family DNA-binding domain-containing protein [Flavobacterium sp. '19STA2R22 D10 B1']